MKKLIVGCLCFLFLCGCSAQVNMNNLITSAVSLAESSEIPMPNMKKKYYKYYLPKGIGRLDSTQLSEVFVKDGYKIIMNFDTSVIVIDEYYSEEAIKKNKENETNKEEKQTEDKKEEVKKEKKISEENGIILYTGYGKNFVGDEIDYKIKVKKVNDNQNLIYLDYKYVNFYSLVPITQSDKQIKAMLKIAKTISFDKKLILEDFSLKSSIDTKKENFDFTQQHIPENGTLEEMLETSTPD